MFKTGKIFLSCAWCAECAEECIYDRKHQLHVAGKVYIGTVSKLKWKACGNVNFCVEDLMCGSAAIFLDWY